MISGRYRSLYDGARINAFRKMPAIDRVIDKIEKGDAWDETDEVVEIRVKKPLDKVIPVRLAADQWEGLRREARELGIGPSTLARMWILERLRQRVVKA